MKNEVEKVNKWKWNRTFFQGEEAPKSRLRKVSNWNRKLSISSRKRDRLESVGDVSNTSAFESTLHVGLDYGSQMSIAQPVGKVFLIDIWAW